MRIATADGATTDRQHTPDAPRDGHSQPPTGSQEHNCQLLPGRLLAQTVGALTLTAASHSVVGYGWPRRVAETTAEGPHRRARATPAPRIAVHDAGTGRSPEFIDCSSSQGVKGVKFAQSVKFAVKQTVLHSKSRTLTPTELGLSAELLDSAVERCDAQ